MNPMSIKSGQLFQSVRSYYNSDVLTESGVPTRKFHQVEKGSIVLVNFCDYDSLIAEVMMTDEIVKLSLIHLADHELWKRVDAPNGNLR